MDLTGDDQVRKLEGVTLQLKSDRDIDDKNIGTTGDDGQINIEEMRTRLLQILQVAEPINSTPWVRLVVACKEMWKVKSITNCPSLPYLTMLSFANIMRWKNK